MLSTYGYQNLDLCSCLMVEDIHNKLAFCVLSLLQRGITECDAKARFWARSVSNWTWAILGLLDGKKLMIHDALQER